MPRRLGPHGNALWKMSYIRDEMGFKSLIEPACMK
jgi:hypothetical protein